MARTKAVISEEIRVEQESLLPTMDSVSNTATRKLWRDVIAAAILTVEKLFDSHKSEVTVIAGKRAGGSLAWYVDQLLKFQYGYGLVIVDDLPVYLDTTSTTAVAAQIVKRVSAVEAATIQLKVATESGGELVALSAPQLVGLTSYVKKIKPPGIKTTIINKEADLVKLKIRIYYDGQLILADLKTTIEEAIDSYFKNIDFNGLLVVNEFIDAIQAITGVNDITVTFIEVKPDGGSYSVISRTHNPASGYFKIDPAFPLSSSTQVEYIAQ